MGPITAVRGQIAGDVSFDGQGHFDGLVTFERARIGGSLLMSGSPFEGPVTLRGAHVVGDLRMAGGGFKKDLDILGMQVDGDLTLNGASVKGDLTASNIDVRHDVVLNTGAKFDGRVDLFDARVANSLHMESAEFAQGLFGANLHVAGDMLLTGSKFDAAVDLSGARIGGSLEIGGVNLSKLDLTGAAIDGSLEVNRSTVWRQRATPETPQLSLVNTKVGAIQDGGVGEIDSCPSDDHPPANLSGWPTGREIGLDGFTYGHLGSSASSAGVDMRERDVCWWRWWLERDPTFSTQPYVQLASVMTAHGDQDNAAAVLYFGRVRETQLAWETGHYSRWMLLAALNIVTGYGIGGYTFRVLGWIVVFVAIGVLLLKWSPGGGQKSLLWRTGASLARVLPGIEINKEFSDFFDDPERRRLTNFQVAAFSAIVIIGWVLGLFLVAAMTGLTQHS